MLNFLHRDARSFFEVVGVEIGTRMKRVRKGGALMVADFFWNTDGKNFINLLNLTLIV